MAAAIVFAVVLAVFWSALDGEFLNWDDDINFLANPGFRGLGWTELRWMWTAVHMGHYIPLTWMSLGLNYVLGGMDPWGYHLGNVLLHAVNAGLFYFVARRLLLAGGFFEGAVVWAGAGFAALVFGVHPLRAESVAWVTERRDVLCGLFFLLAVLTYLVSRDPGARRAWRIASIVAFGAALLCKAQAVPLPVALLIVEIYPMRRVARDGWRPVIRDTLPYFGLALVGGVIAIGAVKLGASFTDYAHYGPLARLGMTAYGLLFYPWKWLSPTALSPLYELPVHVDPLSWRFAAPLIVFLLVTAALMAVRRRWPAGLAAWTYSAVMLLPVVGPLHAGNQLAHDRYSYLSGLGFAVLAGAGLAYVLRRTAEGTLRRSIGIGTGAVAAFVLVALGAQTALQVRVWRDSESLWSWALEADAGCALCWNNLALAFVSQRRPGDAQQALLQSLALREYAMTRNNLGGLLELDGRLAEAEREYRRALELDPRLGQALANLGELYARQARYEEALAPLRRAFEVAPSLPRVRANLDHSLQRRATQLIDGGRAEAGNALLQEAKLVRP